MSETSNVSDIHSNLYQNENVVDLAGDPLAADQDELIAHLEDILARAKNGDIIGVASAYLYADKSAGWNWMGRISFGAIGALDVCKDDLAAKMLGELGE